MNCNRAVIVFLSLVNLPSSSMGQKSVASFDLTTESVSEQKLFLASFLEHGMSPRPFVWKGAALFPEQNVINLCTQDWAFEQIREAIATRLKAPADSEDFTGVLLSTLLDSGHPKTLMTMLELLKGHPRQRFYVRFALIYGYGHLVPEGVRRWYEGLESTDPMVREEAQKVVGDLFDNSMESDAYARYVSMWADGLLTRYGTTPTPEQLLADPVFDAIRQRNPGRSLGTRTQLLELSKRRESERRSDRAPVKR